MCVNVNDLRNGRLVKWKACKMSNVCVCVCFAFHCCSHLSSLAGCLSCSRFAIITFINYESAPGWTRQSHCHCRFSHAADRLCKLLSCWHRLRKCHILIFNILIQTDAAMSGESAAAGKEISGGICNNYCTLLVMMIILLRVEFVCPSASLTATFQNMEWWII